MASEFLQLTACEAGFAASRIPVWICSLDASHVIWANDAALDLWRATSRDELFTRPLMDSAPAHVHDYARQLGQRILSGAELSTDWTFYPKGEPATYALTLRGILVDGEVSILNQAIGVDDSAAATQRSIAMIRHTTTIGALVDSGGQTLAHNFVAREAFGDRPWIDWLGVREEGERLLANALATKETVRIRARVALGDGAERWHIIVANALRDPVTGDYGVLVEHHDETERIAAQDLARARELDIARLTSALSLVEEQRAEILSLSAPILDVGDATLAVPLIGSFDAERSEALTSALLDAVGARGARRVILDMTGLAQVDAELASRIASLVRALQLLGAAPIITGIRPTLAQMFTEEGIALGEVPTLRSLAAGLKLR